MEIMPRWDVCEKIIWELKDIGMLLGPGPRGSSFASSIDRVLLN